SADFITIVILGPSLSTRVTATHAPTTAATIGMNQTSESRVRFFGTLLDSGTDGRAGSRSGIAYLFRNCASRGLRATIVPRYNVRAAVFQCWERPRNQSRRQLRNVKLAFHTSQSGGEVVFISLTHELELTHDRSRKSQ